MSTIRSVSGIRSLRRTAWTAVVCGILCSCDEELTLFPEPIPPRTETRTVYLEPCAVEPCTSIQDAINAAIDGDTIFLANGRYTGPGNREIDYGGRDIVIRSESDNPDSCVIDCEFRGRGFWFHSGESQNSVLQGVRVERGAASGPGDAVLCEGGAAPRFVNVVFARQWEAVYSRRSSPSFHGCKFRSTGTGLGVADSSAVTLVGCSFMNHARSAVVVDMSNLRAMNCIFEQNYGGAGGAIGSIAFEGSASLEVVNCTFLNNEADYGGAIACNHDGLLVEGCTFVGNTAYRGGALELSREAGGLIRGSVFYDNSATIGAVVDCTHLVSPRIEQSIIAFNRDASWIECGVFAEPEFACNDVFGNGEGDAPDCYSDYVGINGNISEDPLFCNAPAGDLRLRESSPCAPSDSCGWMGPYRIGCSTPAER